MKQRRFLMLILSLVLMISVDACSVPTASEYIVDNRIFIQEQNGDTLSLEMDSDVDDIVALIGNSIIYSAYSVGGDSLLYYKFDLDSNTTYELGKIDNPYIHTGSMAQIEDSIYFYMSQVTTDHDNKEEYLVTNLYEIDTRNHSISSIYSEPVGQTLIYVDVLKNDILAFKGNVNGAIGTTFIDAIYVGNKNNNKPKHKVILSAEFDNDKGSGEVIYNFAQSENYIYTLTVKYESMNNRVYLIKQFDSNGNHIRDIKLEKSIQDLLEGERIATFTIIGDYAFIRTFSSSGVLCDISENTAIAKFLSNEELDMAIGTENDKENQYAVLYSRYTATAWILDVQAHFLSELDLGYDKIRYIAVNNRNNALISADNIIYVDYLKLPIKNNYNLSDLQNAIVR